MAENRGLPKAEDLGEGPERRMENFPPPPPPGKEGPLGPPPGVPKLPSADAAGDNDTDELAENMDDATVRFREQDPAVPEKPRKEPPDPRRRVEESKPENPA
jgi:hypothetical protein